MHPVLAQYNKYQQTGAGSPGGHQGGYVHLSLEKKLTKLIYVQPAEKKVLGGPMRFWRSWRQVCYSSPWYRRMERTGINWNMRVKLPVNEHLPFEGGKAVLDIVCHLCLWTFSRLSRIKLQADLACLELSLLWEEGWVYDRWRPSLLTWIISLSWNHRKHCFKGRLANLPAIIRDNFNSVTLLRPPSNLFPGMGHPTLLWTICSNVSPSSW